MHWNDLNKLICQVLNECRKLQNFKILVLDGFTFLLCAPFRSSFDRWVVLNGGQVDHRSVNVQIETVLALVGHDPRYDPAQPLEPGQRHVLQCLSGIVHDQVLQWHSLRAKRGQPVHLFDTTPMGRRHRRHEAQGSRRW